MTTKRKDFLRRLMNVAWGLQRSEPARTFADCLAGAWGFMKRLAACPPANYRRSSLPHSAVRSYYGARAFVGGRGSHAYLTARIGS